MLSYFDAVLEQRAEVLFDLLTTRLVAAKTVGGFLHELSLERLRYLLARIAHALCTYRMDKRKLKQQRTLSKSSQSRTHLRLVWPTHWCRVAGSRRTEVWAFSTRGESLCVHFRHASIFQNLTLNS